MTQDSVFHNGYQIGDARYYSALDYQKVLSNLYLGQEGYIIPSGSTLVLDVTFVSGQTIAVAAGSAFIAGIYYNNSSSLPLTLEDNSTSAFRIDRVVIRVDWETQTARLVVKRGVASSAPAIPSLTQEIGNIYEVSLAVVSIPPSFTGFSDVYIYDDRKYLITPDEDKGVKNLMFNSEFLSGTSSIAGAVPFAMWKTSGSPSVSYFLGGGAKFDEQSRGRALTILANSGDDFSTYIRANNTITDRVTLSFIVHVKSGGPLNFSVDGGVTTLYKIPRTESPVVVTARLLPGQGGNEAIEPHFDPDSYCTYKLGQMVWAFGNVAPPFAPQHEIVLSPARQSIAASSAGDTGLKIYTLSQDVLFPGVKNGIIYQGVADTSSSTSDVAYARIVNTYDSTTDAVIIGTEIGRLTNNIYDFGHGVVPLELQYNSRSPTDYWSIVTILSKVGILSWSAYLTGVEI